LQKSSLSMSLNRMSKTSTFSKTVSFCPLFSLKGPLFFMILQPSQTRFLQL
jgi:hypothetical protein